MPIMSCTLPEGGKGYKWGEHGKCYASLADAEKQAQAAYSNGYTGDSFAFDKANRRIDTDGRLHVERSHISKAAVNPYYGEEIPGWQALGLDPEKIYQMFRDPEELKKAAPTFARLPILSEHVPITTKDLPKDKIIGAIGSDVDFNYPYLDADLCFWEDPAIAGIDSGQVRELSCCYHYVPIMEPGEYKGTPYDGRMTQIEGNHLAKVEAGRAGSDVLVADSNPFTFKERTMKMTKLGKAIFASLSGMSKTLAQDSALPALVGKANRKTFDKKKTVEKLLALDVELDPEQLDNMLDAMIGVEDNPEPVEPAPETMGEGDEDPKEKVKSMLAGKVDDDVINAILALIPEPTTGDEEQEEKEDDGKMDKEEVGKAMDSLRKGLVESFDAIKAVASVVGEVKTGTPAHEVYGLALDELKVDHAGIKDVTALKALFRVASGKKQEKPAPVAQDSAELIKRFPNVARFGR